MERYTKESSQMKWPKANLVKGGRVKELWKFVRVCKEYVIKF